MKHWIYKAKRWLVHKLGGCMPIEVVRTDQVQHIATTQWYSVDELIARREYTKAKAEAMAVDLLYKHIRQYVHIEYNEMYETREIAIRASIRVIDERR